MTKQEKVSQGLEEIGACYAVRSDKYVAPNEGFGAKPTYHIHPDGTYPHQNNIERFGSIDELLAWIEAMKQAEAMREAGKEDDAMYFMQEWRSKRL